MDRFTFNDTLYAVTENSVYQIKEEDEEGYEGNKITINKGV